MDVCGWTAGCVVELVHWGGEVRWTGCFDGVGSLDDFPDHACREGSDVGDYELLVFWRAVGWEGLSELFESKGCDD